MSIARRLGDGKTLVPATHDHAEAFAAGRQSFVAEARMLARFRHPNIVRVRSLFEENGTGYLVMDYLEGRTLASHLVRMGGHVPAETALAIARPLLSALQALHAQNVLHRDLDPHNVYITNQQEVVLLDFGAARQAQVTGDTRSLSVILKPGYAPFEQYASRGRQRAVDRRVRPRGHALPDARRPSAPGSPQPPQRRRPRPRGDHRARTLWRGASAIARRRHRVGLTGTARRPSAGRRRLCRASLRR